MIPTGITLYQCQHCPYCAKVRRAFDQMGLQYRIVECGPDQAEVYQLLGRRQVPAIKDTQTGAAMLESDDIIAYARRQYVEGGGARQGDGAESSAT
jgi:glutaredoxin 3